jgi:hypothetical protein
MGQSKFFSLFSNIAAVFVKTSEAQPLIFNDHEPLSSYDPPSPVQANFYPADDHVYHFINGQWKRTPLSSFNNPT